MVNPDGILPHRPRLPWLVPPVPCILARGPCMPSGTSVANGRWVTRVLHSRNLAGLHAWLILMVSCLIVHVFLEYVYGIMPHSMCREYDSRAVSLFPPFGTERL